MIKILSFTVCLLSLTFSLGQSTYAAETKRQTNGLAMVGQPKLSADFTHFDYANPDAPKGGTLRQAMLGSFDTINPFSLNGKAAQGLNLAYDRLMTQSWDEPFTLYPLIAERVVVPDNRASITFHLNKAATFSDGTKITTDDVRFSFETLRDKGRPNMRNVYKLVDNVIITDHHIITFTLGTGYNRETVMILAKMPVLSKAWWHDKDFNKTILTPPISSGPYRITEVSVGRRVVFERNPDYWGKDLPVYKGLNNFDRMVFDYFRDQTTAFESFKKGDVDVWTDMDPGHWSNAYQFPAKQNGNVTQQSLTHGRVEKMWGFIFNLRRPPFDDIHVREALSMMIDYDWLNRNNFYNQYTPLSSFFPNSDLKAIDKPSIAEKELLQPFANTLPAAVFETAKTPPASGNQYALRQNQLKANALLDSAGWKIVGGQRIHIATGKRLEFEILVSNRIDEKMALAFKRNLAKLGIAVTLRSLDSAAFQDRLTGYDYDMTVYWWLNTLSPGTEQAIYWGCDAAKQNGRFNYSGICHPALENLISKIPNASSRAEMQTMTRALDRILSAEHIAIPLFYSGKDNVAAWSGFQHPPHTPLYGNVMESWFLKHIVN